MFEKIREGVLHQKMVRRCEVEGMIRDVESELEVLHRWRVITWEELNNLLGILKGT